MLNGASVLRTAPSDTEMVTSPKVPTLLLRGVPEMRPLPASKLSQPGRFATLKVSGWPSGSAARGVN